MSGREVHIIAVRKLSGPRLVSTFAESVDNTGDGKHKTRSPKTKPCKKKKCSRMSDFGVKAWLQRAGDGGAVQQRLGLPPDGRPRAWAKPHCSRGDEHCIVSSTTDQILLRNCSPGVAKLSL